MTEAGALTREELAIKATSLLEDAILEYHKARSGRDARSWLKQCSSMIRNLQLILRDSDMKALEARVDALEELSKARGITVAR